MQEIVPTLKSSIFNPTAVSAWAPFLITLFICPLFIHFSPSTGLFDDPESDRKIHERPKPLGGAALVIGFLPIYLAYGAANLSLVFGLILVFLTGIFDDLNEIEPKTKLALQVVAVVIVLTFKTTPLTSFVTGKGLSITLTGAANTGFLAFWLIGGTNGFNLIDGLDGLAVGVSIIALTPLAVLGFGTPVFLPILTLLASLIALLIYNFHPAKLFLGDGGSYFIGFLTSYFVIEGLSAASSGPGDEWLLPAGLLLLALPVVDTAFAIGRRAISRKGIMEADKSHIHHLLYRHYGQTGAVLIIYAFQATLSGLAVILIL